MKDSHKLIYDACSGTRPERTPIFDLLLNDNVIEHFAGTPLDGTNDLEVCMLAAKNGLDGSRWIATPNEEGKTWTDGIGNEWESARWTSWVRKHAFSDSEEWASWIEKDIERLESEDAFSETQKAENAAQQREYIEKLGETVFIHCTPSTAINTALFGYCGLEHFSYLWMDHQELILRWMKALRRSTLNYIDLTAHPENCRLAMIYSDIAYKQRLMFSKDTFNEFGFFDDVADICSACHEKGLQVIFHSDGYIMDIMPDLLAAGIDGLNPLEKAAGMDVYELRRKYPELILVGGVDVTHLLPFGTPEEVRRETRRMINEIGSEGRLLIGSSTELDNTVPLENYLAFWDEVMRG